MQHQAMPVAAYSISHGFDVPQQIPESCEEAPAQHAAWIPDPALTETPNRHRPSRICKAPVCTPHQTWQCYVPISESCTGIAFKCTTALDRLHGLH